MKRTYVGRGIAVLVVAALGTSDLHAQKRSREPDAAEVAALLRARGHHGGALNVLSQAYGPQPRKKMDEIADSLVAIASTLPGNDLRGVQTRDAALFTLVSAAKGATGVVGIDRAVPYAGAADRLMRIAETGYDVGVRGGALRGLAELPDTARVLPFLRRFATSQNAAAFEAVVLLANNTGPEGRAIAHELYRNGLVTQRTAVEMLNRLAGAYKWAQ